MSDIRAVAVVGLGAVLPDAHDPQTFWNNIQTGRYSITDVSDDRWRAALYFNPNPAVPEKTYSKIGGWVRGFQFDPLKWKIAIPPSVLEMMDVSQQWAIEATRQALADYGYPNQRSLNPERVAVILGNTLAGEGHYDSTMRIRLPEYLDALAVLPDFQALPPATRTALLEGMQKGIQSKTHAITEDTMPGELPNIIAGRIANVFNFRGPNFITDAACASSLAATQAAVEGLLNHTFDAVITGGADRNMGAESFVKFSKIGALSPDGSRPYADGANGFVMGEGCAVFLLKRLGDAERDGDRIYAVIRGLGSSSDGKGKGITAPNPLGQQLAIERAWKNAGLNPASAGLIEGHGTSTKVGDLSEVTALNAVFGSLGLQNASVALGSVKSNLGHLKSASGAAAMLKMAYALYEKKLPPSVNFTSPNPQIDWSHSPFYVNTQLQPWNVSGGNIRRAGISSFGFGGTNFHMVIEEHVPGLLTEDKRVFPARQLQKAELTLPVSNLTTSIPLYRGLLFLSGSNPDELKNALVETLDVLQSGILPANNMPSAHAIAQPERIAIDYSDAADLTKKIQKALKVMEAETPAAWFGLTAQAVYRGSGKPGKVAFLFPGQGSQYVNMLRELRDIEPLVADVYRQADETMTPILGRSLTSYIFVDGDEASLAKAENDLKNTAITQPAMLTANISILRLMQKFGYRPDMVIGHSLGEYAALVAAGALTFPDALKIVAARGREMTNIKMADNGCMAAVSAPLADVERILAGVNGYIVIANINSPTQSVIGGATAAVDEAIQAFSLAGFQAVKIPVSHAFHTQIVAPASEPLGRVIEQMHIQPPAIPVVANVTGDIYPSSPREIIDMLKAQIYSPVQFIKGTQTLYRHGVRVFVEVGPKRVLNSLANDILKGQPDISILATNHPRKGGLVSFNEALCGLLAAGVVPVDLNDSPRPLSTPTFMTSGAPMASNLPLSDTPVPPSMPAPVPAPASGRLPITGSVVISGAGLGLPGKNNRVFNDDNVERLLHGQMGIEPFPLKSRQDMLDKRVTRLVKNESGAVLQVLDDIDQTVKLAGQRGQFDLAEDFGLPAERVDVYDISTQLAIAAGIEALRDAGIPLTMRYRQTSKGTLLPDRWMLPPALADETGVIFASAFPGLDRMAEESDAYYHYEMLIAQAKELRQMLALVPAGQTDLQAALQNRIAELESQAAAAPYALDRKYVFRILCMGHSQFAEYIGARGPATHVNAACASTTHSVGIAEDWIRSGRCRRVVIVAGDDVTTGHLPGWVCASLMASGAATVEGDIRLAALPFDRRRNGMIMGMGAAGLVIESEDAARERGVRAIAEVLSTQIANSAFHGTRLDVNHIGEVMDRLMTIAENRFGIQRSEIAGKTVFISHETYTPARGGSAAAEIQSLRRNFGDQANKVVIANTKGYTGHTMGVGIEDVLAVKALQNGIVPPISNIGQGFEPDPELGDLNLSKGGPYPIDYALRLGAGFGSQVAMSLLRKIPGQGERINPSIYNKWLSDVAGYDQAETEVVQRTLRIRNAGEPQKAPAASQWSFGQGPTAWSNAGQAPLQTAPDASGSQAASIPSVTVSTVQSAPAQLPQPSEPAVPSASPDSPDLQSIQAKVLELVAEKTGYPVEMLDLELDLEADLGIDTVKQAELFASVRETYAIPRREDLRLSDYNSLNKVIQFVTDSLGAVRMAAPVSVSPAAAPTPVNAATPPALVSSQPAQAILINQSSGPSTDLEAIKTKVLSLVSEKTGYPSDMLDPELDLEADLGIDTVKQAELFASVRETYAIPRREDLRLTDYNTLEKVIAFVTDSLGLVQPASLTVPPAPLASPETPEVAVSAPQSSASLIPPAAQAAPSADLESIKTKVLSLVSDKTGYPAEMLDLDLDLEADLGIDTVKQAELFASVRETYAIPRREDLRLSAYNNLQKVIQFVVDSLAAQQVPSQQSAAGLSPVIKNTPAVQPAPDGQDYPAIIGRVPLAMLRPRLDLCLETGIALEAGKRVLVVADSGEVAGALVKNLQSRKVTVLSLPNALPQVELGEKLSAWLAEGPIDGVYFLPGLDFEIPLTGIDLAAWQSATEKRAYALYAIFRAIPQTSFLVSATHLGGLFGFNSPCSSSSLSGLVTGFTKAIGQERPDMFVKVVDFEDSVPAATIASRLMDETLHDGAAVEIGWENNLRYGIGLADRPVMDPNFDLPKGSVFVVSGGSGAITSLIVNHLARATQGTFFLLDKAPLPAADDPDLARLKTDRQGLLAEMMKRIAAGGVKATPALAEQRLAWLDRSVATHETLKQVESAGGKAHYIVCDVTDPLSVYAAVQQAVAIAGKVDVFLHAAGIERSRHLESKPFEEFKLIVSVKVDGFYNIFKALENAGALPRAVVFFSSIAGRFGNSGQTDYSTANELLSKTAALLPQQYPGMKAVSIDWGAWAEVGMSARGHIPELMQKAGIEMVHPSVAVPLVLHEILCGSGEVVLAGALGSMENILLKPALDIQRANAALLAENATHVMLSHVAAFHNQTGITLEASLDPTSEPFLKDHAINGIPVLPGVMGIEGFSATARHITSVLAAAKGNLVISRLEDINFLAPFKFYRDQVRTLTWKALPVREKDGLVVYVVLESTLALKTRVMEKVIHFSGRVYMQPAGEKPAVIAKSKLPKWSAKTAIGRDDIYNLYFHGPAFRVLEGVITSKGRVLGKMQKPLPPTTAGEDGLISTPLLIELCLQTAGIWEVGKTGILALPRSIGSLTLHQQQPNGDPIFAEVSPVTAEDGSLSFNARVIDAAGRLYLELNDYRTIGLPYTVEKHLVEPLKKLVDNQN